MNSSQRTITTLALVLLSSIGAKATFASSANLIPSQITQKSQLSLSQDKNSSQFLISQNFIGCGTINDPKPPTNVRSGPGKNFKVISPIANKTFVSIVERKNGWVKIRSDSGIEGWVAKNLIIEKSKSACGL
jgi:uncharacterized protein YgiM (DUF1202 family)